MKFLRCPIPWCLSHSPKPSDTKFLKIYLTQKHSYKERQKIASILGCPNYIDGNSHLDFLISQSIVRS
jgi:hypothetical protein